MQNSHKESCIEILNNLKNEKYYEKTKYFLLPVQETIDEIEWQLYKTVIKNPRDLGTILENVKNNRYSSLSAFSKDVELCFENAIKYNKQRYKPVYQAATSLLKIFKAQMEKLVNNLTRTNVNIQPRNNLPVSTSPTSLVSNKIDNNNNNINNNSTPTHISTISTPTSSSSLNNLNNSNSNISLSLSSTLSLSHTTSNSSITTPSSSNVFDPVIANTIIDVISKLKAAQWFIVPLDLTMPLYTKRITTPIDFPMIKDNIQKRKYQTAEKFATDMRRTFANSLVYNFDVLNSELRASEIRNDAKTCLYKFEQEWAKYYDRNISPPLIELKECLDALEEILKMPSGFGGPAIGYFIDPVRVYYEGDNAFLKKYSQVIKKPMDYGTIISGVCEGRYSNIETIINDAKLIAENCEKWYASSYKSTKEVARETDPLTIDAWMLFRKFQTEISERIPSSLHRMNGTSSSLSTSGTTVATSSIPINNSTSNLINLELDDASSMSEIPKLKLSKGKRSVNGTSSTNITITNNISTSNKVSEPVNINEPKETNVKKANTTSKKTVNKSNDKSNGDGTLLTSTLSTTSSLSPLTTVLTIPNLTTTTSTSATPSTTVSSKKSKVNISLKERYLWCLSELKVHHLMEDGVIGVQTCWPFNLAVDPIQYPTYPQIIKNPMDLSMIEKKIKGDRYPQLISILRDVQLIKDNAYTFNPGEHGKDIRYLADLTLSNFKFLLKQVALEILSCGDDNFIQKHLPSDTIEIIMQPEPLENISSAFYLPRLAKKAEELLNNDIEEKPQLNRRKSVPKQSLAKAVSNITPTLTNVNSIENQLSNEEAGYLLTQDEANNGWMNETESPFDYNDELFEATGSIARPTPGAKGTKGKRQKSFVIEDNPTIDNLPVMIRLPSIVTPLEPWEQTCSDMLKKITRHEFLDIKKPNPKVFKYDFFHPVVELFPEIATEYLKTISNPMDFSIIYERLYRHGFLDSEDVYEKVLLIFTNTIKFIEPNINENDHSPDAEFNKKMVSRSKHMLKYVQWLAHEMLPLVDDSNEANPESLGQLRISLRNQYRNERIEIITNAPLDVQKECNALMKKFENRKYVKDYLYFSRPVPVQDIPDYQVYVRSPMDFFTVKEKLDKHKYPTYGHFMKDLRLIFSNAKTYNKVHMDTDPVSKLYYDAAVTLSERLEAWFLEDFSIDVAERVLYTKIKVEENAIAEAQKKELNDKMNQDLDKFRQNEIARLKSSDLMFAVDQLKRESINGTLEPGASLNILTPRPVSVPIERPPIFYEPETVEIKIPGQEITVVNNPLTASTSIISTPLQTTSIENTSQNLNQEVVREKIWNYWMSSTTSYSKIVNNNNNNNNNNKSLNESMEITPAENLVRSESIEKIVNNQEENDSSKSNSSSFEDKSLNNLNKENDCNFDRKRTTSFIGFSLNQSNLKKSKILKSTLSSSSSSSSSKKPLLPFINHDEDDNIALIHINSFEQTTRANKRIRDEIENNEENLKKQRIVNDSIISEKFSESINNQNNNCENKNEKLSCLYHLPNLLSLFDLSSKQNLPVDIKRVKIDDKSSNVILSSSDNVSDNLNDREVILAKYQTCNGISLIRILVPCDRQYDEINIENRSSESNQEDNVPTLPPLEEEKSQSSLSDSVPFVREASLTLSQNSPSVVTQISTSSTLSMSVPYPQSQPQSQSLIQSQSLSQIPITTQTTTTNLVPNSQQMLSSSFSLPLSLSLPTSSSSSTSIPTQLSSSSITQDPRHSDFIERPNPILPSISRTLSSNNLGNPSSDITAPSIFNLNQNNIRNGLEPFLRGMATQLNENNDLNSLTNNNQLLNNPNLTLDSNQSNTQILSQNNNNNNNGNNGNNIIQNNSTLQQSLSLPTTLSSSSSSSLTTPAITSQSRQAAYQMAVNKRKSEIESVRYLTNHVHRISSEQKFREEFKQKKLIGCFSDKKGGEELRKRALSLFKQVPDGRLRINYKWSEIIALYSMKTSLTLPSIKQDEILNKKEKYQSKNEIILKFSSPPNKQIISNLFTKPLPSRILDDICNLSNYGFEVDNTGFNNFNEEKEQSNIIIEKKQYFSCFCCTSKWNIGSKRWNSYPSSLFSNSTQSLYCKHIYQMKSFPLTYIQMITDNSNNSHNNNNNNSSNVYTLKGFLPIEIIDSNSKSKSPLLTSLSHWNSQINVKLTQITSNIFLTSTWNELKCIEKNVVKNKSFERIYLESWIVFIGKTEEEEDINILPNIDLIIK